MNAFKTSISALALVAIAAGGIGAATLAPTALYAQTTQTAPATPGKGMHHLHRHFDRAAFLEGRIAFIKAVLKITPAQEQAFNGLADAIRANGKDRAAAWEQMKANHDKPSSAVDRLEMRIHMTQLRAQAQERVLVAFKPLFASLTPDQQKVANHLLAGHGHRGMHHGHRG